MNRFKLSLICLLMLLSSLGFAQEFPTAYESSSTSAPSTITQFDFDLTDSLLADTLADHRVIFRDQPVISWDYAPMILSYQTCGAFTFSGQIGYIPPSGILEWYFRSENDTAVVSQSPKNSGDIFPVPDYLMADMGADPTGDAVGAAGSWLDVTHAYVGYSDTKLYVSLQNNGGGFPTNQGLFTYFLYTVGIVDPNTTDSVAYVLVYASVPTLFSPGLYVLDATDSSFTQIGSISTNISGNRLNMSCNISDLTAQPSWSDWPPPAGFIGVAPVTATANFTNLSTNDFGKTGVFIPASHLLDFNETDNAPSLSNASVSLLGEDTVSASITYTDIDGHLPIFRNFVFDGVEYPMTACEKDYEIGAAFEFSKIVAENGWYTYYFDFSDGVDAVTTPMDSIQIEIVTYICGDANADESINVSDAVYIINYVFLGASAPNPLETADPNCDGSVNVSDAVWLINFVFLGANAPCDSDGDGSPDC